jgi:hypothetical protein
MVKTRCFVLTALTLVAFVPSSAEAQSRGKKSKAEDPAEKAERLVKELQVRGISGSTRNEIRKALAAVGPVAAKPLARALPRLKGAVAVDAVDVLCRLKRSATARDALIKAASRDQQEYKLLCRVAEGLALYKAAGSVNALLRLMDIHAEEVDETALKSLQRLHPPSIWKPLLERLVAGDDVESGGGIDSGALVATLSAVLKSSAKPQMVVDVFDACSRARPEFRAPFLKILEGGEKVSAPFLIRLLYKVVGKRKLTFPKEPEGYGKADYGGPLVEQVFAPGGSASHLRPYTSALLSVAARALGKTREPEAFFVLLRGLSSSLVGVRLESIDALGHVFKGVAQERLVVEEVIDRLSDNDRRVKIAAHRFLRRQTKQDLPRSFSAWATWARTASVDRFREAAEQMAIADGFETLRDFLRAEGHQGFDDYLRAGGTKRIESYLDEKAARGLTPAGSEGREDEEAARKAVIEMLRKRAEKARQR